MRGRVVRRLRRFGLVASAVLAAACAQLNPPETDFFRGDADRNTCARETGEAAIAACGRVVARPDAFRWPGAAGDTVTVVHWSRADSAWHLARHLGAANRHEEALAAALKSIELLERYDRERSKALPPPAQRAAVDRRAEWFNAYMARSTYAAGLELVRLRRWPDATRYLRDTVRLDGRSAVAWATLAVAANQVDDHSTAIEGFEKALAIDPGYFTQARSIQQHIFEASRAGRRFDLDAFASDDGR